MTDSNANLFTRNDTFFGICEAIGEDFGFNPNWLRVAFAIPLLFNPAATFGAYLMLGIIVAISRYVAPRPAAPAMPEAASQPAPTRNDTAHAEALPVLAKAA